MEFKLHPNLAGKEIVTDLSLCRVLLENNRHYPWLLAVPRRLNVMRLIDLSPADQLQLIQELDCLQRVLWKAFHPTQLNVAAIGNKTPQLHIHVIARFSHDPAWPATVWDHPIKDPYEPLQKEEMLDVIREVLQAHR